MKNLVCLPVRCKLLRFIENLVTYYSMNRRLSFSLKNFLLLSFNRSTSVLMTLHKYFSERSQQIYWRPSPLGLSSPFQTFQSLVLFLHFKREYC